MVEAKWLDWRLDRGAHIARHGVSLDEFEEAFRDSRRKTLRVGPAERNPSETIYHVYGRTGSGRYLFMVVLQYADKLSALPVTARDMTDKQRRWYRK